jgi:ribosomal protein S18 acetylase RimI-like enzyme
MNAEQLTIETAPNPADVAFLEEQINAFNIATTGIQFGGQLAIFVRNPAGTIVAGVYGWTWGDCCEIRLLWVTEELHGQGYGSRLLTAAEREAIERGCVQVILDTHDFQAPLFYQRHGYEIVGTIDDYPRGYRKYYLRKLLSGL